MDTNKVQLQVQELDERIVPNALPSQGPFRIIGDPDQQQVQRPQNNDRNDRDERGDRNDRSDRNRADHNNRAGGRNNNRDNQNRPNDGRADNHKPAAQQRAHAGAKGTYTNTGESGVLGQTRYLQGNVRLPGLGTLRLTGSLHDVGDVIQGRPGGQVVFSSNVGSITLQLTAAAQTVVDGQPTVFNFRVVDGTGRFNNVAGHGKVQLVFTPGDDVTGTFAMRFARRAAA